MNGDVRLTGKFTHFEAFLASLRELREMGLEKELVTFSPSPRPEIEEALPTAPRRVRYFALFGSLAGLFAGAALTVWTALHMDLITGGKPLISIPPFIIIMFELTVLFGGLATFVGFLFTGKLPLFRRHPSYVESFSEDVFGIAVECTEAQSRKISHMMKHHGVSEVLIE